MKKNIGFDFIFASLSAAALVLFMSCGHQSRRGEDGLFAGMEPDRSTESSEVNVPTEGESSSREISSDLTQSADEASAQTEEKSASSGAQPDTQMDPTQLTDKKDASKPGDELGALSEAPAKVAQVDAAPPAAESLPPMEETVPEAKQPETALLPPADSKASDILAQITVPAAESIPTNIEAEAPMAAETAKPVATKSSPRKGAKGGMSLPKDSLWKKGHTMNRFYFLRNGDTAEKMAEMIYGDKAKALELSSWNPGSWSAGKVIVYESAVSPNDTEMKSFYEERELPSEAYTVKKGDKLANIAQTMYGDKGSWAEIAAFNGLAKNAKLAEGTVINVFPASIPAENNQEETVAVAPIQKVEPPAESNDQKIAAIVASKEPIKEEPAVKAAAEPEAQMVKREHPRQAALANAQVGGFFEEHIAAFAGGMLILLASFFAFRYFRRTRELQD